MPHQAHKIEEKWDEIRSQVRDRWPSLTQDDLQMINGDSRKLVALVHQKTGANLHEIEVGIDEIAAGSDGLLSRATRTVKHAAESISENGSQAYEATGRRIADSPAKSVATAFSVGLLVGFLAAGLFTGPPQKHERWDWR